ncbi:MAG: hypothetical protein HC840_00720 [Leptolyngbyaceae cyanobacterium RM2_2_4]|nr:hypothetical protein [Leptolyngbyaceae cyanobacterium RM2_2_4]
MKKTARKSKAVPKKRVKSEPKKTTLMDRLPKNDGERLELMIRMTERHADQTMVAQAARLRLQLEEWKKANSK